jgi:hypothetical protein
MEAVLSMDAVSHLYRSLYWGRGTLADDVYVYVYVYVDLDVDESAQAQYNANLRKMRLITSTRHDTSASDKQVVSSRSP